VKALEIRRREVAEALVEWPADMHPVLRRVLAGRGIRSPAEIEHRLANLAAPVHLGGIESACELLCDAIDRQRQIVIVGDFDADGATGTAVAMRGLRMLGAGRVDFRVPNRALHGYGLSAALVDSMREVVPDLIVTVDNGIASLAGVAAARERGIDVLVTDHHLPGAELPDANVIVNPNLAGDCFPSKALAGVGVMFYVLIALRAHMRKLGRFATGTSAEPDLSSLLDLVALGTVADMVSLDQNNRILVAAGLRQIRNGHACAGIRALLQVADRDPAALTTAELGFVVAPRINAAGRLEDMGLGIECLTTDDDAPALELAHRLSAINAERREIQSQMVEQAEAAVARWTGTHGEQALPCGVVLFEQEWHPGVVGLVASRLKEQLHRPVVACAPAMDGSCEIRASLRSIRGVHARDILAEIDANEPGLIQRFGGHAMAAGLTLARASLERFTSAFAQTVQRRAAPELFTPVLLSDGPLSPDEIDMELAELLRHAIPWGQGLSEPTFDNTFELKSFTVVGGRHWRMQLIMEGSRTPLAAMYFNAGEGVSPPTRMRAAYRLDINVWGGQRALQLIVQHLQAA
jgi:single-stranded-DNA-specific exonuclease